MHHRVRLILLAGIAQARFESGAARAALMDANNEKPSYQCSQNLFKCDVLFNPDPAVGS